MVRIVSGQSQQEDPNAALLQGMQMGQMYRQAQAQRAALEQQQMGKALQLQNLHLQMKKFQLQREALLQKKAGEGNVAALQALALEAKKKPSQSMAEAGQVIFNATQDPKVRAQMYPLMKELIGAQQNSEHMESVQQSIGDLLQAGVLDETGQLDYQQRLASGVQPAVIAGELQRLKKKHAEDAAISEENQLAMQPVLAQIEAAPAGPDRDKARARAKEVEMSPSKHTTKGYGAEQARLIQEDLIGGHIQRAKDYERDKFKRTALVAELHKAEAEKRPDDVEFLRQQLGFGPDLRTGGAYGPTEPPREPGSMQVPFTGGKRMLTSGGGANKAAAQAPKTQSMQRHVAVQKARKETRYPGSTKRQSTQQAKGNLDAALSKATSGKQIREVLQANGIPLTHANLSAYTEQWARGR